ncbi:MAG: hypothetical protein ACETVQ_00825 [Candidatus Bathyarchaeia archaeon]
MKYVKTITVRVQDKKVVFPPFCSNCLTSNPDKTFKASKAQSWSGFDVKVDSPTFGVRTTTHRHTSLEIPICSMCYKKCRGMLGFREKWHVRIDSAFPISLKGGPTYILIKLSFANAEYAQMLKQANPGAQ